MTNTIKLTGVSLPGTHPNITEFVTELPAAGLQEYWQAGSGITLDGSDVAVWSGFAGSRASGTARPEFLASLPETGKPGVQYVGTEVLTTDYHLETTDGYVVIALRIDETSDDHDPNVMGQRTGSNDKFMIGTDFVPSPTLKHRPTYSVGSMSNVQGLLELDPGDLVVIGVAINGSSATLRGNGAALRTDAFTGTFGQIGSTFSLGGDSSLPTTMFNGTLAACAIYRGTMTTDQLAAIDTAMGAFVGLSI